MKKMKLKWVILPAIFLSLAIGAAASFYANVDILVSNVSFGNGTSTAFTIKAGSRASTGWNFSGGNFSVTNPQGFSVTAPAIAKTFLISSSSLESCVVNTAPGTTNASLATSSGIFYITPSSVATCVSVSDSLSTSSVTTSTASLSGAISSIGAQNASVRGFVWSISTSSLNLATCLGSSSSSGSFGLGSFSLSATSLASSTTYYFKSFTVNRFGTAYSATYGTFRTGDETTPSCSTLTGAVTYNAYPTCGAASCSSGYTLSGSGSGATCASSGGSGGGGGGAAAVVVNTQTTASPSQGGNINKVFSSNNSVELIVPANAVSSITTFNVSESSLTADKIPTQSSGAVLVGNQVFNISAVGSSGQSVSSFTGNLTITIKVSSLPATTTDLGVYYFDEQTKKWTPIPGAVFDAANKKVTFISNHLTLFAIFRIIGTNLNSIVKPVEAQGQPVMLATPVISEVDNIVNRYYPTLDPKLESQFSAKVASLKGYSDLNSTERDAILKFSTYGTLSTYILGAGERLGVINSYLSAFKHLPKTASDFSDVIKISTGHWPTATSPEAIAKAKISFKKIYLREANMNQPNDNAAVTIMAYGLRNAKRNMNSEKVAIKTYKAIFKNNPTAATDWDAVRAIAYSGAKR